MITIYGKNNCNYCDRAKALTEAMGFPYEYKNAETDPAVMEELMARNPSARSAPQIWWDDRYIGSFDQYALEVENTSGGYGEGTF